MDKNVIIRAEGLGKKYALGQNGDDGPYRTFRETLGDKIRSTFRRSGGTAPVDEFWALRDINFEVRRGEVVAFVGRNGAGKSTLLKVLSRITEPTTGRVSLRGRVASLLEVGTGFHPELTGRENIYLNGAILGMSRREIKAKFDEIVEFAEVTRFLDTPVKRYSSGMYVRLAFAVAAHLEPEILIIDEVLAVGDADFQKKCLGKMDDVAKREGRTVLFVSHNMVAVNALCESAVWLEGGRQKMLGSASEIVSRYLTAGVGSGAERVWPTEPQTPDAKFQLLAVRVLDGGQPAAAAIDVERGFVIEIKYRIFTFLPALRVSFRLTTPEGAVAFQSYDESTSGWFDRPREPGTFVSRCEVPGNLLNELNYLVSVAADVPFVEWLAVEESILAFKIERQRTDTSLRTGEKLPGVVSPRLSWQVEPCD